MKYLLFIISILYLISNNINLISADCQACDPDNGGICTTAYRGGPGKYCGHWRSYGETLPCCCPLNSECSVTTSHCGYVFLKSLICSFMFTVNSIF